MEKGEIIKLLVSNNYYYEDAENEIDIKIKRRCHLTLYFRDNLLVDFKEKVKYNNPVWKKWITLKSMLRREIIGSVILVLFGVLDNLYIGFFNINNSINLFFFLGITTLITGLIYYFYFIHLIKKTIITLQLHLS